jgi:gamma-glutamyltranspeptidase/glutathione hydrolase
LVVTTHQAAADAGAAALASGGCAVDALVAGAFAMCVVDPANCGIGGYGGFLTYAPANAPPMQVDFNTWVPPRYASTLLAPGETEIFIGGGGSVAPPSVVRGLITAHRRFGRLHLAELIGPAICLARDGSMVGRDLAAALARHWQRTNGGAPEFASIFYPRGRPLKVGARLVQRDLAMTLGAIRDSGLDAFAAGQVVEAICETTRADGGFLDPADFLRDAVFVGPAETVRFESAAVFGPSRPTGGTGVLFEALGDIDSTRLGVNRDLAYRSEFVRALGQAWAGRLRRASRAANVGHTTHLSATDADGGCAALTFTHGSLDFGSGLVAAGTGVVLNGGVNLFAPSPEGPVAVTNMAPIIIDDDGGTRHTLGATGGPRIPGMLLSAVIDVVHYGWSLAEAFAAPHLSVRASDGSLEAEPELMARANELLEARPLAAGVSFGPICGVTLRHGESTPGIDPRFDSGVA